MKTTTNLGLKKPEGTDIVNIDDINYNADIMDAEIGNIKKGVVKVGASGSSDTAAKLQTPRAISLNGDLIGNASFDGSANICINARLQNSGVTTGSYTKVSVDEKGRVVAGSNPMTLAGYGITDALPASSYTAADVLNKLKAVHGEGSGLNADLLDGKHSNAFATAAQGAKADTALQTSQLDKPGGVTSYDVFKSHLADDTKHFADKLNHIPYAVAIGSANTYAVTLNPAPTAYVDGMAICVKINVVSTGASTLNVNGLGAKAIKDSLGNAITNGGLKSNTPYTLRYESTSQSFIVQGKGGGGNATPDKILSGYTATVDSGPIIGTMASKSAATYTPATANQTIAANQYLSGIQTILGDANLIAANILEDKSIFGVKGTANIKSLGGLKVATGTASITFSMLTQVNGPNNKYITLPLSLSFTPKIFIFYSVKDGNLASYRVVRFIDCSALGLNVGNCPLLWVDEGIEDSFQMYSFTSEYNMFFPPNSNIVKVPYYDTYGHNFPSSCVWIAIG